MTTIGTLAGVLIILYGLITLILKRSLLFGGDQGQYTEASIKLFAILSGLSEMVAGLALALYNISIKMDISYFIRCAFLAVIWIALIITFTFFLTVLVKKH